MTTENKNIAVMKIILLKITENKNNNFHSKSKINNASRGQALSLINTEDSRIFKVTNQIKVTKQGKILLL